jgi:hypothetical protein
MYISKKNIFKDSIKDSNVSSSQIALNKFEENDSTYYIEHASQIKTNIINKTFKVIDNNTVDDIILHFNLDELTSWDLLDNMISIYTSDEIPTVIRFSSNDEAEEGNERINRLVNGEYLS